MCAIDVGVRERVEGDKRTFDLMQGFVLPRRRQQRLPEANVHVTHSLGPRIESPEPIESHKLAGNSREGISDSLFNSIASLV